MPRRAAGGWSWIPCRGSPRSARPRRACRSRACRLRRLDHRHRASREQVLAPALEHGVLVDREREVQVAGWATGRARVPGAGHAELQPVCDTAGDADRHGVRTRSTPSGQFAPRQDLLARPLAGRARARAWRRSRRCSDGRPAPGPAAAGAAASAAPACARARAPVARWRRSISTSRCAPNAASSKRSETDANTSSPRWTSSRRAVAVRRPEPAAPEERLKMSATSPNGKRPSGRPTGRTGRTAGASADPRGSRRRPRSP